jgi:hypothetical protein
MIISELNNQHPQIQFEIEHTSGESHNQLCLLDFEVTVDENEGVMRFQHYKKSAKNIFLHFKSTLPLLSKINIARNERAC